VVEDMGSMFAYASSFDRCLMWDTEGKDTEVMFLESPGRICHTSAPPTSVVPPTSTPSTLVPSKAPTTSTSAAITINEKFVVTGIGVVSILTLCAILSTYLKRSTSPPIREDKDISDEESGPGAAYNISNNATSQAKYSGQVQEPDLSSDSHVPSRLLTTDDHKYKK